MAANHHPNCGICHNGIPALPLFPKCSWERHSSDARGAFHPRLAHIAALGLRQIYLLRHLTCERDSFGPRGSIRLHRIGPGLRYRQTTRVEQRTSQSRPHRAWRVRSRSWTSVSVRPCPASPSLRRSLHAVAAEARRARLSLRFSRLRPSPGSARPSGAATSSSSLVTESTAAPLRTST